MLHPKKVGKLKQKGSGKEKQTNEIKTAAPMLDSIDITGRTITADALLTQKAFAHYLVKERSAHYHFTVKANQKNLLSDIQFHFQDDEKEPDFIDTGTGENGRIEIRKIWCTRQLNHYLKFPFVEQAFKIYRESICKKTGTISQETIYGITSKTTEQATPKQVLTDNRGHWCIESCHYIIDWNYDEDRSQIRAGAGPENITRLRRFAIGILKSRQKKDQTISEMMKKLMLNTRAVFDYLKMTKNSNIRTPKMALSVN
ncbi:MAG: ISAs1 family transposase [Xanthomonadales bacterium]|nr:ISAs1 family transposase [Xanthomonadales bacterium]